MYVRHAETKGNAALTLPSNTLLFRTEGPQVGWWPWMAWSSCASVKLGRDFGRTVEILAGVHASEPVIRNPPDSLTDGVQVRIVESADSENAI